MKFRGSLRSRKWLLIVLFAALPVILFASAAERKSQPPSTLPRTLHVFAESVTKVAFAPDGHTLAAAVGAKVYLWDTRSYRRRLTINAVPWIGNPEPDDMRLSADGLVIFVARVVGDDCLITVYDSHLGKLIDQYKLQPEFQYSGEARFFSTEKISANGTIDIVTRRVTGRKIVRSVRIVLPHGYRFDHCGRKMNTSLVDASWAVSPSGRWIVADTWKRAKQGSCDEAFLVYNAHSGKLVHQPTFWPTFSSDDRFALDSNGGVWDTTTWSRKVVLKGQFKDKDTWEASPDRTLIALVPYGSEAVQLFSVQTGNKVRQLKISGDLINTFAFSPDSTTLVTGTYDGSVRLWRLR